MEGFVTIVCVLLAVKSFKPYVLRRQPFKMPSEQAHQIGCIGVNFLEQVPRLATNKIISYNVQDLWGILTSLHTIAMK